MDYMEHRWGERLKVEFPVRIWTTGGIAGSGSVLDLSVSGAFVSTRVSLSTLSPVNVFFQAIRRAGSRGPSDLTYLAHVVRRTPDGFGIEWFDFATEDFVALTAGASRVAPLRQPQTAVNATPLQGRKGEYPWVTDRPLLPRAGGSRSNASPHANFKSRQ